jgi:hypothetical protein
MDCMLNILVSRADVGFLPLTVSHLVRSCAFPFRCRRLLVDSRPLSGEFAARPGIGTLDELHRLCHALRRDGVVDSVAEIDYSEPVRRGIMTRHFGRDLGLTHDSRGCCVYGRAYGIATAGTEYFLHFDSDMLLYQAAGTDWVATGIDLLQSDPNVFCVLPLPGPPTADGSLDQPYNSYSRDLRGHYVFKTFTSRKFLIDVARFESALPLPPPGRPGEAGDSRPCPGSWEAMVSKLLRDSHYVRADLASPTAWTLHPVDHGPEFIRSLPEIIAQVERGWFPPAQAGKYDLVPELWGLA